MNNSTYDPYKCIYTYKENIESHVLLSACSLDYLINRKETTKFYPRWTAVTVIFCHSSRLSKARRFVNHLTLEPTKNG